MFGSGMGAVSSVLLTFLSGGAHVVAQQQIYANADTLMVDSLTRLGIEVTQVDQTDPEQSEAALRPETKLIYLETPANPLLALTDLSGQGGGLHIHPCPVVGYVIAGAVRYQVEGEGEQTLAAGQAFYEPAHKRIFHFDNPSRAPFMAPHDQTA